jgi:hypothetical protein
VTHKIEDDVVTEIVVGCHVADLSPVRALVGLKSFGCDQLNVVGGRVLHDPSTQVVMFHCLVLFSEPLAMAATNNPDQADSHKKLVRHFHLGSR